MKLTESQQAAVQHIGNAAIVAAPGSGKTLVLVEKVALLVEQKKVPLEKILLVTFTEKAATEFKNRLAHRLKIPLNEIENGWIGTLHAALARFLRRDGSFLDIPPDFTVLEEHLANLQKFKLGHERLLKNLGEKASGSLGFINHFGFHRAVQLAAELIDGEVKDGNPYAALLKEIRQDYNRLKKEKKTLDFQDLELWGLKLLEDETMRKKIQNELLWILVDEFQDTSPMQWKILKYLHEPIKNHFVIVGDPRQSIYRFRGARPELFWKSVQEIQEAGGDLFYLDENFRTRSNIVDYVNRLSPKLFPDFPRPMKATRDEISEDGIEILPTEIRKGISEQREGEAQAVAERILALHKTGTAWNQIAILFRTRQAMSAYEAALESCQIPYETVAGEPLLERPEVLSTLFVLKKALNPEDSIANLALSVSPLKNFTEKFPVQKPLGESLSPFFEKIRAVFEGEFAKRNLEEFESVVSRLLLFDINHLKDLLQTIDRLRQDGARITCPLPTGSSKKVRLLTIHSAKGLEFPIVILADLEARASSSRPPYLQDPDKGILFKEKEDSTRGLKDSLKKSSLFETLELKEKEAEREESCRLLYVALTRAKDRLILPIPYSPEKKRKGVWSELLEL